MLLALTLTDLLTPLALFGFAGQAVFMGRFVLQWFASERRGRSYVPVGFWWLSLAGGLMLMLYATLRQDPVFMFGQLLGIAIYVRNLMLIRRRRKRLTSAADRRSARRATPRTTSAPTMLGEIEAQPRSESCAAGSARDRAAAADSAA